MMMTDRDLQQLQEALPGIAVRTGEPMSRHTTFRCGGPAALFVEVRNAGELQAVLEAVEEREIPFFLLGRGSNLLVSDAGYDGAVITLGGDFTDIRISAENPQYIEAGAGASLTGLSAFARDHGLTGLEFACGIPGSTGGGIIMNAGAYGGEMKDVTVSVDVLPRERGAAPFTVSSRDMAFGYRTSRARTEGLIVLRAVIGLQEGDSEEIGARMEELLEQRRQKQPLEFPSAGSTFKRPEGYFAGKLIQDAGLSGFRIGDAQVSEKHCGFVINRGSASASEIAALIAAVQEKVYENSGVMLEREVIYLGSGLEPAADRR